MFLDFVNGASGLPKLSLVLAPILVALYWTCQFVYNVWFHPLAKYPGPILHRGSEIPKVIQQMRGTINSRLVDLHAKYGPVVRIAPGELTYITANAWKEIYGNKPGKGPLPPSHLYGMREKEFFGAFSLLWLEDHKQHARHRRIMAPAFSDQSLRSQEPVIRKYVDLFMLRMQENAGNPVDLAAWFNFTTFDIIGDLAFGEPFGCLENSEYHPWIHYLFSRLKMMMYGQIMATMTYLSKIVDLLVPQSVKQEAMNHVQFSIDKVNRRRVVQEKDRPDFMTHFLEHTGIKGGLDFSELYANANILVIAGSETSATLLAVAMYYLLSNREYLDKVCKEIRDAFDSEDAINFAGISKLPYLRAVIDESLRIHSPLPAGFNRFVPKGGAIIDGEFVHEGTMVQVPHWAAYHSESNFRDPYTFAPQRWLGDERYADDNRDVFQPFSIGPRNCIGRSLANMETRLILARLMWNFDMELMPSSKDWPLQKVYLLYEKKQMHVVLTPVKRETA
ncbi:Fc.00g095910.m01.CDS01 [Cosmosporella sp. VM-42]